MSTQQQGQGRAIAFTGAFQANKHTKRATEKEWPLQSPVHVSQIPCVLWHRLSNTEIECVCERENERENDIVSPEM